MRRGVFVGLVFVLALGVAFSAQNVGIGQEVNGQKLPDRCVRESLPPGTHGSFPPPKRIRNLPVCTIYGTDTDDEIEGTNKTKIVDKIVGEGGDDTLYGRRGWNGLIGDECEAFSEAPCITGKDTLVGGRGRDYIFAQDAVDDEGFWHSEIPPEEDTIRCGRGTDTVFVDVIRDPETGTIIEIIDKVARDCEKVKPAEPDKVHWFRRTFRRH